MKTLYAWDPRYRDTKNAHPFDKDVRKLEAIAEAIEAFEERNNNWRSHLWHVCHPKCYYSDPHSDCKCKCKGLYHGKGSLKGSLGRKL
jgi:hypothetical protein